MADRRQLPAGPRRRLTALNEPISLLTGFSSQLATRQPPMKRFDGGSRPRVGAGSWTPLPRPCCLPGRERPALITAYHGSGEKESPTPKSGLSSTVEAILNTGIGGGANRHQRLIVVWMQRVSGFGRKFEPVRSMWCLSVLAEIPVSNSVGPVPSRASDLYC